MNQHFLIGDNFILEPDRYRLVTHNKETPLSQKETELLVTLCTFSLSVVERGHLLNSIWGNSESGDIGLNKNILMLRRKFESFGVKNAIQTVPRIGYMLLLEAKPVPADSAIEINEIKQVVDERTISSVSPDGQERSDISMVQPLRTWHVKRRHFPYIVLTSVIAALMSIYFIFSPSVDNSYRLIDSVDRYDSPLGVLFIQKDLDSEFSDDITHAINDINNIFSRIADHAKYYILASKENISIVSIAHNGTHKQSNFLVENGFSHFREELLCAVNNITDDEHPSIANEATSSSSFKFVSMRFFSSCQDKNFLLDLNVKRSGHPDKIKTLLQNFSAKDSQGTALFHFDRTSERQEISYPDGSKQAIFHNAPASFNIDAHDIVGNSDDILKIIGEFTAGEVRQTTIDSAYGVFMSDTMGGILYLAT
ncbi:winged helix-turn-helix domain-containing protein (plasmid) [Aeromonas sp. BC14]|nr:winged helix-turn-helix domain-containing protein [Aeromonas sp. BC14]WAF97019.1 winged helix-turn-helix domain-containing protein [Aeromonas sp. BC14]